MASLQIGSVKQEAEKKEFHRLAFLDCMRGFAALAVVIQHVFEKAYPSFENWSVKYFHAGMFGVVVFFLVSGFIIPTSIERHGSVFRFWIGRFFRLFPIYWASLITAMILGYLHIFPVPDISPLRLFLGNLTMLQEALKIPHAIGVYWTLSLELIFYAACSALFAVSVLRRSLLLAWMAVLFCLGVNIGIALAFHASIPAGRLGLLVTAFFGTLLYRVHRGEMEMRNVLIILPALSIALLTGFWIRCVLYPKVGELELTFTSIVMAWFCAFLLVAVIFFLRRRSFPAWTQYLGKISYSLYLIHALVLYSLPGSGMPWVLLTIGVSIGLSALTFRYIEQPAITIGSVFGRRP